jgi:hypothetical protein
MNWDDQGLAAIETAKRILPTARMTAIVRLYSVAMVFIGIRLEIAHWMNYAT